jgi:hypothetical protein
MKGMGASCTASRSGVIFSVASARPTGQEVRNARTTNKKGETGKTPAVFIGFLEDLWGAGRMPALYMFQFNSIGWAQ